MGLKSGLYGGSYSTLALMLPISGPDPWSLVAGQIIHHHSRWVEVRAAILSRHRFQCGMDLSMINDATKPAPMKVVVFQWPRGTLTLETYPPPDATDGGKAPQEQAHENPSTKPRTYPPPPSGGFL